MPYLNPMRLIFLLLLLPFPAQAWTFTPGLICLLEHETDTAKIALTFDPAPPRYTVTVTSAARLPAAPYFSMKFIGPAGQTISTNRHVLSDDSRSVTVADTGFGNVLDGLQFNDTAQAILGSTTVAFPLEDAAGSVAQFRKCETAAGV